MLFLRLLEKLVMLNSFSCSLSFKFENLWSQINFHAEDMKRQCLLADNHKKELSEYWKLTCGQLSQPMDVENKCKVFMRYPQSIADADHIVVCTICYNKYKSDPNALPKSWECQLGKDNSTTPLLRHLNAKHRTEFTQWQVVQSVSTYRIWT
jgi:hypothetical protein